MLLTERKRRWSQIIRPLNKPKRWMFTYNSSTSNSEDTDVDFSDNSLASTSSNIEEDTPGEDVCVFSGDVCRSPDLSSLDGSSSGFRSPSYGSTSPCSLESESGSNGNTLNLTNDPPSGDPDRSGYPDGGFPADDQISQGNISEEVLFENAEKENPQPRFDSNNSFDSALKFILDSRCLGPKQYQDNMTTLAEIDFNQMSREALDSSAISDPVQQAQSALLMSSLHTLFSELKKLKEERSTKELVILSGDCFEIKKQSCFAVNPHDYVLRPGSPLRNVNVMASLVYTCSAMKSRQNRTFQRELTLLLTELFAQMVPWNLQMGLTYSQLKNNKKHLELPEHVANDIARLIATHVGKRDDIDVAPRTKEVELSDWIGVVKSAICDVLGDGPKRRANARWAGMTDIEYKSHLRLDMSVPIGFVDPRFAQVDQLDKQLVAALKTINEVPEIVEAVVTSPTSGDDSDLTKSPTSSRRTSEVEAVRAAENERFKEFVTLKNAFSSTDRYDLT